MTTEHFQKWDINLKNYYLQLVAFHTSVFSVWWKGLRCYRKLIGRKRSDIMENVPYLWNLRAAFLLMKVGKSKCVNWCAECADKFISIHCKKTCYFFTCLERINWLNDNTTVSLIKIYPFCLKKPVLLARLIDTDLLFSFSPSYYIN